MSPDVIMLLGKPPLFQNSPLLFLNFFLGGGEVFDSRLFCYFRAPLSLFFFFNHLVTLSATQLQEKERERVGVRQSVVRADDKKEKERERESNHSSSKRTTSPASPQSSPWPRSWPPPLSVQTSWYVQYQRSQFPKFFFLFQQRCIGGASQRERDFGGRRL